MRILLTNDDGFDAPGLIVLKQVAAEWGSTVTVAPDQCYSGCGHQTTTRRPLELIEMRTGEYQLDGAPADCTRVGIAHLAARQGQPFDWVFAGVNAGGNLGADVYCSGTVAAVREAALLGVPAVAISQYRAHSGEVNWPRAAVWARVALSTILGRGLPPRSYWNVNLPDPQSASSQSSDSGLTLPEIRTCPVDGNPMAVSFVHENGVLNYSGSYQNRPRTQGSDIDLCFSGNITISCITLL